MLRIETKEIKHKIEYMGATFFVIPLTATETDKIIKENTYMERVELDDPKTPARHEKRTDYTGIQIDKIVRQIVGWEGIADNIECNTDNKRKLADKKENEHICVHLIKEIAKIGRIEEEKKKESEKT